MSTLVNPGYLGSCFALGVWSISRNLQRNNMATVSIYCQCVLEGRLVWLYMFPKDWCTIRLIISGSRRERERERQREKECWQFLIRRGGDCSIAGPVVMNLINAAASSSSTWCGAAPEEEHNIKPPEVPSFFITTIFRSPLWSCFQFSRTAISCDIVLVL